MCLFKRVLRDGYVVCCASEVFGGEYYELVNGAKKIIAGALMAQARYSFEDGLGSASIMSGIGGWDFRVCG